MRRTRKFVSSSIILANLAFASSTKGEHPSPDQGKSLRGGRQAQSTTCYSVNPSAPDSWCVTNLCPVDSCVPGPAPASIANCVSTGGWTNTWCQTHGCPPTYCKSTSTPTTTTTSNPTKKPTRAPTAPTRRPTNQPTKAPSSPTTPTRQPSKASSTTTIMQPTKQPTKQPSLSPTTAALPTAPTPAGAWEGWATTTVFGSGETVWPSGVNHEEDLTKINNPNSSPITMGGAIPWRFYCREYGGRQKLLDAVYAAWTQGTSTDKVCFEVQPIIVTPSQLAQGSYDLPSLKQSGKTIYDISDNAIQAVDSTGKPYPIYQIVPYEGCGGNCQGSVPDCANNCYADPVASGGDVNAGINAVLNCDYGATTSTTCSAMRSLWDAGAWSSSSGKWSDFLKYSCKFAVNYATGGWEFDYSPCGMVNWCSGFNLHFDVALDQPYWYGIKPQASKEPAAKSKGDYNNIVVRYRRTACQPWK